MRTARLRAFTAPREVPLQTAASKTPAAWQAAVEGCLTPLLGDFTAKMTVRTAALRTLKRPPEQLGPAELPALIEGMKPIINTLLGAARAAGVLDDVRKAVGL